MSSQRHGISSEELCSRLDTFFSQLSKKFRYAVKIRNAGLVGPNYRKVLELHGDAHVYHRWSYMLPLREQHQRIEGCFTAPFTVLRLMQRSRMYMKPRGSEQSRTRRSWKHCQKCATCHGGLCFLVSSRSEGNAPLRIEAAQKALQLERQKRY